MERIFTWFEMVQWNALRCSYGAEDGARVGRGGRGVVGGHRLAEQVAQVGRQNGGQTLRQALLFARLLVLLLLLQHQQRRRWRTQVRRPAQKKTSTSVSFSFLINDDCPNFRDLSMILSSLVQYSLFHLSRYLLLEVLDEVQRHSMKTKLGYLAPVALERLFRLATVELTMLEPWWKLTDFNICFIRFSIINTFN